MTTGVWGDDFADDDVFGMASLQAGSDLADGECARFFPSLRAKGGDVAPELLAKARARAGQLKAEGHSRDASWVLSVLAEPSAREAAGADRCEMARFSFLTGVHPAYLWPTAESAVEFGTTAAWLGELSRWGRAYAPPEVAGYLMDVLTPSSRGVVVRDEALVKLPIDERMWPALQRAAVQRLRGQGVVVRWRTVAPTRAPPFAGALRWADGVLLWFKQFRYVRRSA